MSTIRPEQKLFSGHQVVGEVIELLTLSPYHVTWSIFDLQRLVIPPIRLGQYRLYRRKFKPVAFVSWAWLTENAENGYTTGTRLLQPEDWNSGDRLWFIDFVAPFGGVKRLVADLRNGPFKHHRSAMSLRRNADGSVRSFQPWYGPIKRHPTNRQQ